MGMKALNLTAAVRLIEELPPKYAAIAAIGVTTGCRITEILSLRRFDLITKDGAMKDRISFLKLKAGGGIKSRKLAIPASWQGHIIRHLNIEADRGYVRPDDLVFRGQRGKRLSRLTVYQVFRTRLGAGYGTHWMRKTFAGEMFRYFLSQNSTDPMRALELTRRALGHERIDTTIRYLGINEQCIDDAQSAVFNLNNKMEQKNER